MSSLTTNVTNLWPEHWSVWPPEFVTVPCHCLEAASVVLKTLSHIPSSLIYRIGLYTTGIFTGAIQNRFCKLIETDYNINELAFDITRLSTSSALKYFKHSNPLIFLFDGALSLLQYSQRNSFYHTTTLNQETYNLILEDDATKLTENFKQGAQLNVQLRPHVDLTPLEFSVVIGNKDTVQAILDAGASIRSQYNAMMQAILFGFDDILIQLIEHALKSGLRESTSTLIEQTIARGLQESSEVVLTSLQALLKNRPIKINQSAVQEKSIRQAIVLIGHILKTNSTIIAHEKLSLLIQQTIERGLKTSPKAALTTLIDLLEDKQININKLHLLYAAINQAIILEEPEALSLLIEHVLRVDPNARETLSLLIHPIVEKGAQIPAGKELSHLKLLLKSKQIDINQKDTGGQTPLLKLLSFVNFYAIFKNELHLHPEKILITEQFTHEARAKADQETAMRAIYMGMKNSMDFLEAALKLLIQNQADPNIPDKWGNTALHWAAINQLPDRICEQLITAGADKNLLNQAGWSYYKIKEAIDDYKEEPENYNFQGGGYKQSEHLNRFFKMMHELIRNNVDLYQANEVGNFKAALLRQERHEFDTNQKRHLDEMNRILKELEKLNKK